ncbi:DhaKLM operon coactivator DhaQ [Streptococcus porcinus]|uniref:DhaKLM operon coactivator DhaQ n=2 Tax=Streptococcus porcinus TaxID=1340 RepID=A0A4V0H6X4_STRPO|nr:DhaKLM operon coactivator DhaQ [Streptococcus porcinus]EGJ26695.1 putative dihydroxyacetone kinase DhaK1b subunit [Streptococcus porcinus str. Jelinkova 176]SQG44765.1 DhaKLM operon coactivator DhaQ [Streptococcus porcinus]VTT45020.1 DhaKLM operon coactivator DhaQ [Streptococcus porcinus]VTT46521.1 DhaKLM operon coactivator DhaQ [Streptococcus porcinus]
MVTISNHKYVMIDHYIKGMLSAHPHLAKVPKKPIIYNKEFRSDLIPILSGGGSGHEPAHIGFIGDGMLTAAVYGDLFTPPSSEQILEALRFLNKGKGVFVIIKNFEADIREFSKAIHQARLEGIPVRYIISHDDISVEPKKNFQMRHRGLAGTILLHKILGQAALQGAGLKELEQIGFHLATEIATIGFATKSPTFPNAALPLFELPEDHISFGIGIHGEEGYRTVPFTSSEHLAVEIVNKLQIKFHWQEDEKFILLANNLGTTTELEQGIFLNDLGQLLELEGLDIAYLKNGKYMTSLDMAGISVTLARLKDPIWLDYLKAPTNAFAW